MSDPVMNFSGRCAVMTSGATEIGEACAHIFVGKGAAVVVMDFDA